MLLDPAVTRAQLRASWSLAAACASTLFVLAFGYLLVVVLAFFLRQSGGASEGVPSPASPLDPHQHLIRPVVQNASVLLLFLLPTLTMNMVRATGREVSWRSRSADRATPVQVVLARFVAAVTPYAIVLAVTVVGVAVVSAHGTLRWPTILTAYLGLLLLGAGLLALGVLVAGITTKPVIGVVATMGALVTVWALGPLDGTANPWLDVATSLSPFRHVDDFAKGVIDTAHVAYHLALIVLCLALAVAMRQRTAGWSGDRATYVRLATAGALALAVLAGVNALATRFRVRWDLTETRAFSLSEYGRGLLQRLDAPVRITVFARPEDLPRYRDRLDPYVYGSPRVSVAYLDPSQAAVRARHYDIESYGTIVLDYKGRIERVVSDAERDITNGLARALNAQDRTIYFTAGHGEKDIASPAGIGYSGLVEALARQDYRTASLASLRHGDVPMDATVVVVAGPRHDFLPREVEALARYLAAGGRLLLQLDPRERPDGPGLSQLAALARDWGVHVGDNLVVDVSGIGRTLGTDPATPVATRYPPHAITERFTAITAFPLAREISPVSGGVNGRLAHVIIESDARSWAETDLGGALSGGLVAFSQDDGDRSGPVALGSAVADADTASRAAGAATGPGSRLVVIGDSDFVSNAAVGTQGNLALFLNVLEWLGSRDQPIAVSPPPALQSELTLTPVAQRNVSWLVLLVLPGAVFLGGVSILRRNVDARERERWIVGNAESGGMTMTKFADQTTRLLCASVLFDYGAARKTVLDWIRDPNRAVADEVGIDVNLIAAVARFAERRNRRYWLLYFALSVVTVVLASITMRGGVVTVATVGALVAGMTAAGVALALKRLQDRNTFVPMFQLGRFSREEVAQTFGSAPTAKEASAMPAETQDFYVYAGFMPFVGAGHDLGGWSVAIALDKPKDHLGVWSPIAPFEVHEIGDAIDRNVRQLGLINVVRKDCYFASGLDLRGDASLLPDRFGRPVQCVSDEAAHRYAWSDSDQVRHYRRYQIVDWGGELALSYYLRCVRRGNTLYFETKRFILTPLTEAYRGVDGTAPLGLKETLVLVVGGFLASPFLLAAAPVWMLFEVQRVWQEWWGTADRARRELIDRNPLFNYGAAVSLRQMLASGEYGHYFQKMDGDLFNKALEREVLDALIAFLDEHGIETSDLKERQTTILNSGVIVHGGDVRAESLAVGIGAQARTETGKAGRKGRRVGAPA